MTTFSTTTSLPITKAARLLGVHPNTLRAWADQGRVRCLRVNERGDRRFLIEDLRAFKAQTESRAGIDVTTMDMVTTVDSKVSVDVSGERVRSDVTEVGYRVRESDDYPGVLELFLSAHRISSLR